MRKVNYSSIIDFLQDYQDGGVQPALSFYPVVDNVTVFGDNFARALQGEFSKVVSNPKDYSRFCQPPNQMLLLIT